MLNFIWWILTVTIFQTCVQLSHFENLNFVLLTAKKIEMLQRYISLSKKLLAASCSLIMSKMKEATKVFIGLIHVDGVSQMKYNST